MQSVLIAYGLVVVGVFGLSAGADYVYRYVVLVMLLIALVTLHEIKERLPASVDSRISGATSAPASTARAESR
jgi:hypothetical protein